MYLGAFFVDGRFTLSKYSLAILNARQWHLMGNSLLLSIGAGGGSLLIGIPSALILDRMKGWWVRFLWSIFLIPLFIPPSLHAISWTHLLGRNGPINGFLMNWLYLNEPPLPSAGVYVSIWVLSLAFHPLVTLTTLSGLRSIAPSLEEAALLSMPAAKTLPRLTLPLVANHIVAGALLVGVFTLTDYVVPDLLQVRTYPVELFIQFSANYDNDAAVATTVPLLILTVLTVCIIRRIIGHRPFLVISPSSAFRSSIRLRFPIWVCILILFIIVGAIFVPIIDFIVQAKGLEAYLKAWQTAKGQYAQSIVVGIIASVFSVGLAFLLADAIIRQRRSGYPWLEFCCYMLFAIPATLIGIGLIQLWNRPQTELIYSSFGIVIMAHTARFLPFLVMILVASREAIDSRLEEAFWLHHPGYLIRARKIVFPLIKPGLGIALIVGFLFSLGEVGATLLVIPPGGETLPIRIYSLLHYGANRIVAVLGLSLIVTAVAASMGLAFLVRRTWKSK